MSIFFTAKLLKVNSGMNDKNQLTHQLVFESKKYDRGLEKFVDASQNVKLHDDDHAFLAAYQSVVGQTISVPVTLTTMTNSMNIFYKTEGIGYRIFKDVTHEEQKTVAKP